MLCRVEITERKKRVSREIERVGEVKTKEIDEVEVVSKIKDALRQWSEARLANGDLLLVILHGPEIERQWRDKTRVFAVRTPEWAGDEDGESV